MAGTDEHLGVADVYAAALFELARRANTVDDVRQELEGLVQLMDSEPGFDRFLSSSAIDDDDRTASLERMFRGKLSDVVLNTLQVMNRHDRAGLVRALLRAFVIRLEHAAGQVEVTARSAVDLTDAEQAEVRRVAAELTGRDPLVRFERDERLLGGLVLEVGDYRFDGSLRQRLQTVRARLVDRGERGFFDLLNPVDAHWNLRP